MYSYVLQQGVNTDCMLVALANLLFEIIVVLDGVLSLSTWFSRDLIDDVCLLFVFSAAFTAFIVLTVCLSVMSFVYDFIIHTHTPV